jgi:hypothetical protein
MLHHCLCSAIGIPHSTQTRTRGFGWLFENSFEKNDIVTTARELPGADTPPVKGMRRIKGPGGLQKVSAYSDPSARPTEM